ncbi:hypothetical protein THAOC_23524 [Thalassiosira oceanica]|uniref:Uncharacterized protein n=1 Tax=Thalassiosira oceanica TaxID=159749 RepID=K0RUA0_THAOC|nr:hypothetical protein THAOC_23524 [Thalassiosira oceanica]|eukprot:EJK56565.1 hypothetical protein THAOC_23524 [Thalassiosira oceanica]
MATSTSNAPHCYRADILLVKQPGAPQIQQISNYDTNKTHLDEAPFGRADDDNWPGSEPPPHDRKRYVSTFITSRRWSPAAVGKLSFPRFKVYYLPRRCVRFEPRPLDLRHRLLHDARAYGRSEDHGWNKRNHRNRAFPLAPASPYSFGVALRSKDI